MNIFDRIEQGFDRAVKAGQKRSHRFDHVWRALALFNDVDAGRLAAAVSFYAFFAAFSLAVVAYSILGRVLGTKGGGFIGTVNDYLSTQLNWVYETAKQVGSQEITIIGSISLILTGVAWIDALRSSSRAVWRIDQHPGIWIVRRLIDVVMLVVLGVLLALSLAAAGAIGWVLDTIAGPTRSAFTEAVLWASGPLLEFAVNMVLAAALLTVVPRITLSARRLIPTAIFVAIGIQLLNTIGRWYIGLLDNRPAYTLVTGTVGLLVYLYLLNQLILFGAALAATAKRGTMTDLSSPLAAAGAPSDAPDSTTEGPAEGIADQGDDTIGEPHAEGTSQPR